MNSDEAFEVFPQHGLRLRPSHQQHRLVVDLFAVLEGSLAKRITHPRIVHAAGRNRRVSIRAASRKIFNNVDQYDSPDHRLLPSIASAEILRRAAKICNATSDKRNRSNKIQSTSE